MDWSEPSLSRRDPGRPGGENRGRCAEDQDRQRDGTIETIVLRRLRLPLNRPFKTSYACFTEFEPILVEIRAAEGSIGWGEGHVIPGSSVETRAEAWSFALATAPSLIGKPVAAAYATAQDHRARSPVVVTAFTTAMAMATYHPWLAGPELRVPLLVPLAANEADTIAGEVERRLSEGYRTFKVKVGPDPAESLARVRRIQKAAAGRARLRLDANRAFSREQGRAFAQALDPDGIELFEQPCRNWDDNAAVAVASPVPLMLDESISTAADIERAAGLPGVGFCKLKLKRFGSLEALRDGLCLVRSLGLRPVLGDGLSSDLGCWMEARAGADLIFGAGEFNGFLKLVSPLMTPSIGCVDAHLVIPTDSWPTLDPDRLREASLEEHTFGASQHR